MPNPTAGKGITNASLAQLLVDDDRRQRKEMKKGAVIGGEVSKKKGAAKGGATGNKASKGGGNAKARVARVAQEARRRERVGKEDCERELITLYLTLDLVSGPNQVPLLKKEVQGRCNLSARIGE